MSARTDLVLVGGGHAHVQVLRRWVMQPPAGVRLTVVLDRPEAVYSGMVPGLVAGDYPHHELEIDVVPLARRAGARIILAAATAIDPVARRIAIEGRPAIPYELASLDVGSTIRGLDLPGVREHALATRPIGDFVRRLDHALRTTGRRDSGSIRVVVVGAGAAGLELAFTLRARLRALGRTPAIQVLSAGSFPGFAPRVARRILHEAARRGIAIRHHARVLAVGSESVQLAAGDVPADLVVWATGAAPLPLIAASPLPLDTGGFVRVRRTLQVIGHDDLFAAGDCAAVENALWVRKAGVYAVRAGPVLEANLRASLRAEPLRIFRPQRDFLSLLNLGERRAIAAKWGVAVSGKWIWRWKDRIDRRFMRRFQVLAPDGAPAVAFPRPTPMHRMPMACGGCAAKVGPTPLAQALARLEPPRPDPSVVLGPDCRDDAAAISWGTGPVLLATIDGFPAFTDDPWLVGRVAAVNAVNDVFAKGGYPTHALALVTVPDADPLRAEQTLYDVLSGVRAGLDPLGVTLLGGHSTIGHDLMVGLAVLGGLPTGANALEHRGACPGDAIILTKPLGTGIVLAADARSLATGRAVQATFAHMLQPNRDAARIAREVGAHACTDVSGFGLLGHLATILRASNVSAHLSLDQIPSLDGAPEMLEQGIRSTTHLQNHAIGLPLEIEFDGAGQGRIDLLMDPQTAGGLLITVPASEVDRGLRALHAVGDTRATVIGGVIAPGARGPHVLVTR